MSDDFDKKKKPPDRGDPSASHGRIALGLIPGERLTHRVLVAILEQLIVASDRTVALVRLDEAPGAHTATLHGLGHGGDDVKHVDTCEEHA